LFSPDDAELLDLAFLIHDVGEALRGDVSVPEKNQTSEQFEKQCGEYIFQKLLKPEFRSPNSPEYKRLREAYDINFNASHRLNSVFKTYEQYSYLNGASIATTHPKNIANAYGLVEQVLANTLPQVLAKKSEFSSAEAFLKDNTPAINDMFALIERGLYEKAPAQKNVKEDAPVVEQTEGEKHSEEKAQAQHNKYLEAKDLRFSSLVNEFYHQQHIKN